MAAKTLIHKIGLYQKLLLGYLILLVIMILPCTVSIYSLSQIDDLASSLAQKDIGLSTTIEYLRGLIPSIEAESRRYVTLHKENSYQIFEKLALDFQERLVAIRGLGPDSILSSLESLEKDLAQLRSVVKEAMPPFDGQAQTVPEDLGSQKEEEIKKIIYNMMLLIQEIQEGLRDNLKNKSAAIFEKSSAAKRLTAIILLCAVVFALLAPWFLYLYIKRPIKLLREGTLAIGQGKFDHKIPVIAEDELGELANAFNNMAERLNEIDKIKSDFIAVASHELKTPLAAMVEASRLLSEPQIGELNNGQRRLVEVLNQSMNRFKVLVEDLLDLSRLQAGLVALDRSPLDIDEMLEDSLNLLAPLLDKNEVRAEIKKGHKVKTITGDKIRISRALVNILDNAIKFSPRGSTVKIETANFREKGKDWIKIGIIDAGPGIEPGEATKIFDKFYQIQSKRRKGGSGLGLAIAKEIILAHGGKIWVESPPEDNIAVVQGSGAAFWFSLPCH